MFDELDDEELPGESDLNDEDSLDAEQVRCPECGAWVYEDADQCPHCGSWIVPSSGAPGWKRWVWLVAALLVAAALVLMTVW